MRLIYIAGGSPPVWANVSAEFVPCDPFGDYRSSPNSVFMTLSLGSG